MPDKVAIAKQINAVLKVFVQTSSTSFADEQALEFPVLFPVFPDGVNEDGKYVANQIIQDEGQIYRVVQEVTPLLSQPPHGEGMLAIYRPIVFAHEGTLEDPIPFIEGMDCERDKYYSYNGEIYKAIQDMTPCIWAPGSQGTEAIWEKVN